VSPVNGDENIVTIIIHPFFSTPVNPQVKSKINFAACKKYAKQSLAFFTTDVHRKLIIERCVH